MASTWRQVVARSGSGQPSASAFCWSFVSARKRFECLDHCQAVGSAWAAGRVHTMARSTDQHIDFLEPVRGFAILMVFLLHSLGTAFGHDQLPWGTWFRDFGGARSFLCLLPLTFGWAGVAVFFVVSGFCIHLSFSRQPSWSQFLQKRFYRIYPPYLLALLVFAFVFPVTRFRPRLAEPAQFATHLGLVHNLDWRWFYGINSSFWSIAVEVQLYALYPPLVFLTKRLGWGRTLAGIAVIEVVLRLADGILLTVIDSGLLKYASGSPFMFWFSWSIGAFIAERHIRKMPLVTSGYWVCAVGIAAIGSAWIKPVSSMSFLFFALLTGGVISRLLWKPVRVLPIPGVVWKHLQQVGVWSFSLYLFHQPLLWAMPVLVFKLSSGARVHPLVLFSLCLMTWAFMVPLARMTYHWVELPSVRLGKLIHGRGAAAT